MDIEIKSGNNTYTLRDIPELESQDHIHVLETDKYYIVLGVEEENLYWHDMFDRWPSGVAYIQRNFGAYGRNRGTVIENRESDDEDPDDWYMNPSTKDELRQVLSEEDLQQEELVLDMDFVEKAGSIHNGTYTTYCNIETPTRLSQEDEDTYNTLEATDYVSWFEEFHPKEEHPWSKYQIEATWWLIDDCKFASIEQLHEHLLANVTWKSASTCYIKTAAFPEFIKRCREHYYMICDPEYYYNVSCTDHSGLHYYIGSYRFCQWDSSTDVGVLHILKSYREELSKMDHDKRTESLKATLKYCLHLLNGDSSQCISSYIFDKTDIILDDWTVETEIDSIFWEDERNIPTYMEDIKNRYVDHGAKLLEYTIL